VVRGRRDPPRAVRDVRASPRRSRARRCPDRYAPGRGGARATPRPSNATSTSRSSPTRWRT